MSDKIYSIKEFAKVLGVHPNTIRNSLKSGRILGFRVGKGKKSTIRIMESEIMRMLSYDMQDIVERIVKERIDLKKIPEE